MIDRLGSDLRLLRSLSSHPASRGRRARTVARALLWQVRRKWSPAAVTTLDHGLRFRVHPDSVACRIALYHFGRSDFAEIALLEHYLRPGDHFVDVGANVGVYSLFAAHAVGPTGRVDAFEPGLPAADRFADNMALNGFRHVVLHRAAASDTTGSISFSRDGDDLDRIVGDDEAGRRVECVRLDDVLDGHRLALGKIDVEGAEPLVLSGAARLLRAGSPPLWILEVNGLLQRFGWTEERFAAWLAEQGYGLALYEPETRALRLAVSPWRERANVLAVRLADLEDVRARLRRSP